MVLCLSEKLAETAREEFAYVQDMSTFVSYFKLLGLLFGFLSSVPLSLIQAFWIVFVLAFRSCPEGQR